MSVVIPTLPPLPAYPAAGPERDEWHRLARLHMDATCAASQLELAEANRACEAAQRDLIKMIAEMPPAGSFSFEQVKELLTLAKGFINADEPKA